MPEPILAAVDQWAIANNAENRSEAIRRILMDYLKRRAGC
jgi:metal-responsive CopG/Arc/MetJ family transcriptional regulator